MRQVLYLSLQMSQIGSLQLRNETRREDRERRKLL